MVSLEECFRLHAELFDTSTTGELGTTEPRNLRSAVVVMVTMTKSVVQEIILDKVHHKATVTSVDCGSSIAFLKYNVVTSGGLYHITARVEGLADSREILE